MLSWRNLEIFRTPVPHFASDSSINKHLVCPKTVPPSSMLAVDDNGADVGGHGSHHRVPNVVIQTDRSVPETFGLPLPQFGTLGHFGPLGLPSARSWRALWATPAERLSWMLATYAVYLGAI